MAKLRLYFSLISMVVSATILLTACGSGMEGKASPKQAIQGPAESVGQATSSGCTECDPITQYCQIAGQCYYDPPCCDCDRCVCAPPYCF